VSDARRFLEAVDDHLPLVAPDRDAVIDELADHLDASVGSLHAAGASRGEAEREAVAMMGDPAVLADDLAKARTSRRILLPAVGYAALLSARTVFVGWLWGGVVVLVIAGLLLGGVLALSGAAIDPWTAIDGVGVVVQVVMPGFFAFIAGRYVPFRLAHRAHRSLRWARLVTAAIGLPVIVVLLLLGSWDVNSWVVAGLVAAPLTFLAGVSRSADTARPILARRDLAALAVLAGGLCLVAIVTRPAWLTVDGRPDPFDRVIMGPVQPLGRVDLDTGVSLSAFPFVTGTRATFHASGELPAGLTDPALELWLADASGRTLAPGATRPLAMFPMTPDPNWWDELTATVDLRRYLDWPATWAVLAATDAHGERVVLDYAPNGRYLMYHDRAIDWLLGT
jgi:hypothetical protein